MRRTTFRVVASFAFLFLCKSAEARGHHSSYRHINSRGHVSYYHGHGGGHHHAAIHISIPISAPTDRPHKYLYRYTCYGANGPHYCYKYPPNHPLHEGGYVPDAPPASTVDTPVPNAPDEFQHLARELGVTTAARAKACGEPAEAFEQRISVMLTDNSTRPMSPVGEQARKYFEEGLHSGPQLVEPCPVASVNQWKATARFLSLFYDKEGRPDAVYRMRLNAARYETMCQSAEIKAEGERISAEMLEKLGLMSFVLPIMDARVSGEYAKDGESRCTTAARMARW